MDAGFGHRLRDAMARRRVQPGQLARDLEVAPQTVSRWRRGECPDNLRLPEIAAYLRVALDWLKTGVGTFEPTVQAPGDPSAQRAPAPGRRREDQDARAALLRKDAARLDVLIRLIQAYRDAGRPASPDILAEWLDIAAANPPPGATPPAGGGSAPPAPDLPGRVVGYGRP